MKKNHAALAAILVGSALSSAAWAQGVEPTLLPANPALAAGQQASTRLGPISMGETGLPVQEPWRPAPPPVVIPPPPPPPPPPPVYVPPPPPPPPPAPPPLAPRPDRN